MPDIEIAVEQITETHKGSDDIGARLVTDGDIEVWIPKSCINDYSENRDGDLETIFISEYLATEKGLI